MCSSPLLFKVVSPTSYFRAMESMWSVDEMQLVSLCLATWKTLVISISHSRLLFSFNYRQIAASLFIKASRVCNTNLTCVTLDCHITPIWATGQTSSKVYHNSGHKSAIFFNAAKKRHLNVPRRDQSKLTAVCGAVHTKKVIYFEWENRWLTDARRGVSRFMLHHVKCPLLVYPYFSVKKNFMLNTFHHGVSGSHEICPPRCNYSRRC